MHYKIGLTCVYNEQIFYFRTYTKYIKLSHNTIYIYTCHIWYMLHSDNSYDCLKDKKKRVCLAFSKLYSFVKSNFRQNVYRENKT